MKTPETSTTRESLVPFDLVRGPLVKFIQRTRPDFVEGASILRSDLNDFSSRYVVATLEEEVGEISELEAQVVASLREHDLIATRQGERLDAERSFGERLADDVASFGGSWTFIVAFSVFFLLWIVFNAVVWTSHPPDPYPFILLNLILSCVAAFQAPVIMMSQNRLEARDRARAEDDYRVNLKAELEIRHLHEKMDHLLQHHSRRLLEIQNIQVDLMHQVLAAVKPKDRK